MPLMDYDGCCICVKVFVSMFCWQRSNGVHSLTRHRASAICRHVLNVFVNTGGLFVRVSSQTCQVWFCTEACDLCASVSEREGATSRGFCSDIDADVG